MIKTQEQYRELLEARLEQLDEFNFGSSRLLRGLAAGGLALAGLAGMQGGAMHVTPQEGQTTTRASYTVPASGEQLNQAAQKSGAKDLEFGNFPPHTKQVSLTRLHGYQQGQQIPHSVRGFFDTGNSTQVGGAAKTVAPGEIFTRNVTTNTGQQFNAYSNSRTGVESGQRLPFSTQNAGYFGTNISTQTTGFQSSVNAPTPSVFGSGLAGAGLLAGGLGAVALAQRAVRRGGTQQPPAATPTTSGGLQSPPPR